MKVMLMIIREKKKRERPKETVWLVRSLIIAVRESVVCWLRTSRPQIEDIHWNPNQWRCGKTNGGCGEQLPAKIRDVASACVSLSEHWLALSFEFFWSSHAHISLQPFISHLSLILYVHLLLSFRLSSGCLCLCLFFSFYLPSHTILWSLQSVTSLSAHQNVHLSFPLISSSSSLHLGCCEDWLWTANCSPP